MLPFSNNDAEGRVTNGLDSSTVSLAFLYITLQYQLNEVTLPNGKYAAVNTDIDKLQAKCPAWLAKRKKITLFSN